MSVDPRRTGGDPVGSSARVAVPPAPPLRPRDQRERLSAGGGRHVLFWQWSPQPMELPRRDRGDELLKPGALLALRGRLRDLAPRHDLATVIACAFDHRTRMLPFIYADTRMVPAGVRAVGSAMVDAGFPKTRIVLQQWNRRFRPSRMQLDGRVPDLFMVSTMGMHSDRAVELIRDARRIDPKDRPLIIAGGSHAVYE